MSFNCNKETIQASGKEITGKIKEIIKEGNATKITVFSSTGKVLLNIPATLLVGGILLAPFLAGISAGLAFFTKCKIVVERNK